ncbi:MAG: 30S ribosomal protein S16 [Propionibacteriaceae bacterium]|nr:30S ribosomal protein S16 [Propionibacteriaceae bacterium]
MAVKIRLKKFGKIRSPHYRIVVMDARQKRDGRAIEEIGLYHPKNDPSVIEVKSERAQYWLGVGAQPTEAVVAIFKRSGDWQAFTGDTSIPSGVTPQKPRVDRLARYNEAVAAAGSDADAVTTKKSPRRKPAEDAAEAKVEAEAAPVTEAPVAAESVETVEAEKPEA